MKLSQKWEWALFLYSMALKTLTGSLIQVEVPDLHGTYKSNNSPSHAILLAYCKWSKTGGGNGLG